MTMCAVERRRPIKFANHSTIINYNKELHLCYNEHESTHLLLSQILINTKYKIKPRQFSKYVKTSLVFIVKNFINCNYPELTELSTSGQDKRRLQKAIVGGFSGTVCARGTRSEPPRRGGGAGARQSRVRRRALRADAPSVGSTRGNPATIIHDILLRASHARSICNFKRAANCMAQVSRIQNTARIEN